MYRLLIEEIKNDSGEESETSVKIQASTLKDKKYDYLGQDIDNFGSTNRLQIIMAVFRNSIKS
jgi:hypothetical protein